MKLKRTVIKPATTDNKKDEKNSNNKVRKSKENKVSFKLDDRPKRGQKAKGEVTPRGQSKSKGKPNAQEQKSTDQKSPRPPPKTVRRSWEKNPTDSRSARPKTSRGHSNRVQTEHQREQQRRADDDEDEPGDGRQSAVSSESTSRASSSASSSSSGSSSSYTSSSGSSSSSSGSSTSSSSSESSRSSSVISRSDSAMSTNSSGRNSRNGPVFINIDNKEDKKSTAPDENTTRPKEDSVVGDQVIEGEDDESRAALEQSFWGSPKHKGQHHKKPDEQTTAPKSSPGGTDGVKHDNSSETGISGTRNNSSYVIRLDEE